MARKLRQLAVSKKWVKNDIEKIMQRGDHRDGLVVLIPMVESTEDLMPRTRIDELVNKWRGEIVFGIGAV